MNKLIALRNEIRLREAMCARMVDRRELPSKIYEVREPLERLYSEMHAEEARWLAERGKDDA